MSIKHLAGIAAIAVLILQGCTDGKSRHGGTAPVVKSTAALYGDDPVAFKKRLDEARKPFDQCVDAKLPIVPGIPGNDQEVADFVIANCRNQLGSINAMLDKSHLKFDPEARKDVIEDVVDDAEDRIFDAH
jgi:hypothetical protein